MHKTIQTHTSFFKRILHPLTPALFSVLLAAAITVNPLFTAHPALAEETPSTIFEDTFTEDLSAESDFTENVSIDDALSENILTDGGSNYDAPESSYIEGLDPDNAADEFEDEGFADTEFADEGFEAEAFGISEEDYVPADSLALIEDEDIFDSNDIVLADDGSAPFQIDKITITIAPPQQGRASTSATSSVSISTPGIASYSAFWQNHTGVMSQEPETLDFMAGSTYYAMVFLYPEEGYEFKRGSYHDYDAYTNNYYYDGTFELYGGDIESAGIYYGEAAGSGRMLLLLSVKAVRGKELHLALGRSEGGVVTIEAADCFGTPQPFYNDDPELTALNYSFENPTKVLLTAVPDEGYEFAGWYEGIIGSSYFVEDYEKDKLLSTDTVFNVKEALSSGAAPSDPDASSEPVSAAYTPIPDKLNIYALFKEKSTGTAPGDTSGAPQPAGTGSTDPGSDPSKKGNDGTDVGAGASAAHVDQAITGSKSEEGPSGTRFGVLCLRSPRQTKTSIQLKWNKALGATSYILYGSPCGKTNRMQKLLTLGSVAKTKITKAGKKIKAGTYYKFILTALDKNNTVISTSKVIHIATPGGKTGNHKSITISKNIAKKARNLGKGKTLKLSAQQVPQTKKLKIQKHRGLNYEADTPGIATISKKGIIKGVSSGTCHIYAYAQSGAYKKITVTVK